MGERGPVPKRSTERRRRNKESEPEIVTLGDGAGVVARPEPDSGWHPIARDWFLSLGESGQAQFYEPSDWQVARFWGEVMSRALSSSRISAQLVASIHSGLGDLLTTEASRRRVRMEIERGADPGEIPAGVTALAEYRKALGK